MEVITDNTFHNRKVEIMCKNCASKLKITLDDIGVKYVGYLMTPSWYINCPCCHQKSWVGVDDLPKWMVRCLP